MHAQTQTTRTTNQKNTATTQSGAQSDKKAGLRAMGFAEAEQALSPDGSNREEPQEWKKVPPEIEALGLKHVKVTCTPQAWAELSEDERGGVIEFLVQKEAQCENDKDLKSSRVDIAMGGKIRAEDEKALAEQKTQASDNQARLRNGEGPMGTTKTIGVKEGEVSTQETQTTRTTDIPIKEAKVMEDHFAAAGSTFDSADYKPEDMQEGSVMELLEQAVQKILEYLALDPNAVVSLNVVASESHVPNPPGFEVQGSLAAARAANAVALAQAHFAASGVPLANVSFNTTNLGAQGPPWDPELGSRHPDYTANQFVRLDLKAQVQVDTGEKQQVTETITETTQVGDSQIIKMMVEDRERKKFDGGGGDFMVTKNNKRYKSDGPKKPRKNNANQCGP